MSAIRAGAVCLLWLGLGLASGGMAQLATGLGSDPPAAEAARSARPHDPASPPADVSERHDERSGTDPQTKTAGERLEIVEPERRHEPTSSAPRQLRVSYSRHGDDWLQQVFTLGLGPRWQTAYRNEFDPQPMAPLLVLENDANPTTSDRFTAARHGSIALGPRGEVRGRPWRHPDSHGPRFHMMGWCEGERFLVTAGRSYSYHSFADRALATQMLEQHFDRTSPERAQSVVDARGLTRVASWQWEEIVAECARFNERTSQAREDAFRLVELAVEQELIREAPDVLLLVTTPVGTLVVRRGEYERIDSLVDALGVARQSARHTLESLRWIEGE